MPGYDTEDLLQVGRAAFCQAWDKSDEDADEKMRVAYSILAAKREGLRLLRMSKCVRRTADVLSLNAPCPHTGLALIDQLPAEANAERDERVLWVRKALEGLCEAERSLLQRIYFDEEPVNHIAESLGLHRGTIYNRLQNALRNLRMEIPLQLRLEGKAA